MTTQQNQAFLALLQSWNVHQDLRVAGASIVELAASRAQLDQARRRAARRLKQAA